MYQSHVLRTGRKRFASSWSRCNANFGTRPSLLVGGGACALALSIGMLSINSVSPAKKLQCDSRLNDSEQLQIIQSHQSPMRSRMEQFVKAKQKDIVKALEELDGHKFRVDSWTRKEGGEGISCVLQDTDTFDKAGVNVSIVHGRLGQQAIQKMRADHKSLNIDRVESIPFFAAGLSLVVHPRNPMAPTVHLNYRYFEVENEDGSPLSWWFGGGSDLTPSYLFDEDAIHFHKTMKEACDRHDRSYYPQFKAWCDKYFWIKHRNEARGVGGIFFDDLEDKEPEQIFSFIRDCADSFIPAYLPILLRRKDMTYGPDEKMFQQIRRGRYVEFNLVHDRGTSFGLNTPGARVESILMSLPLTASWYYQYVPSNLQEERLVKVLREPRDWV